MQYDLPVDQPMKVGIHRHLNNILHRLGEDSAMLGKHTGEGWHDYNPQGKSFYDIITEMQFLAETLKFDLAHLYNEVSREESERIRKFNEQK